MNEHDYSMDKHDYSMDEYDYKERLANIQRKYRKGVLTKEKADALYHQAWDDYSQQMKALIPDN